MASFHEHTETKNGIHLLNTYVSFEFSLSPSLSLSLSLSLVNLEHVEMSMCLESPYIVGSYIVNNQCFHKLATFFGGQQRPKTCVVSPLKLKGKSFKK